MPPEEKCQLQVGLELWTFQYVVQCYHQVTLSNLHLVFIQSSLISRLFIQWHWNEAIHTICMDRIQSLLPSGSLSELSRSILVGRLTLGITTRIAYTPNTRMVCRYITRKKIRQVSLKCSSSTAKGLGTRLLCTVTNQDRHNRHADCRQQLKVELHIANRALQFTLANFQQCETYIFMFIVSCNCVTPTIMHYLHGTEISMYRNTAVQGSIFEACISAYMHDVKSISLQLPVNAQTGSWW